MIHISQPFTSMQTWSLELFKRNKTKLICLLCLSLILLIAEPTWSRQARRLIDGKEAELFDAWIKTKDGTQYGFGGNPGDISKLIWIVIANGVAWVGMFGFKIWDRLSGKGDEVSRTMREMRDAILRLESNSKHWVTEKEVGQKVRDEIKYLKDHKGLF